MYRYTQMYIGTAKDSETKAIQPKVLTISRDTVHYGILHWARNQPC